MSATCHGNGSEHCCWVGGAVCEYLEEHTVPGRRWACGLLRRGGSWAAMRTLPEYRPIGEKWLELDRPFNYCETYDPAKCRDGCAPELEGASRGDVG